MQWEYGLIGLWGEKAFRALRKLPGLFMTRREFLKSSAFTVGALNLLPSGVLQVAGMPGANGKFVVAQTSVTKVVVP